MTRMPAGPLPFFATRRRQELPNILMPNPARHPVTSPRRSLPTHHCKWRDWNRLASQSESGFSVVPPTSRQPCQHLPGAGMESVLWTFASTHCSPHPTPFF